MIVYGDALSMSLPGLAHAWYAFEDPDSNRPSPDDHDGIASHLRKTRGLSPGFLMSSWRTRPVATASALGPNRCGGDWFM